MAGEAGHLTERLIENGKQRPEGMSAVADRGEELSPFPVLVENALNRRAGEPPVNVFGLHGKGLAEKPALVEILQKHRELLLVRVGPDRDHRRRSLGGTPKILGLLKTCHHGNVGQDVDVALERLDDEFRVDIGPRLHNDKVKPCFVQHRLVILVKDGVGIILSKGHLARIGGLGIKPVAAILVAHRYKLNVLKCIAGQHRHRSAAMPKPHNAQTDLFHSAPRFRIFGCSLQRL